MNTLFEDGGKLRNNSTAFEVTVEDVINVLRKENRIAHLCKAEELFNSLDFGWIEKEALYGDDLEEQTEYAYDCIWEQIKGRL